MVRIPKNVATRHLSFSTHEPAVTPKTQGKGSNVVTFSKDAVKLAVETRPTAEQTVRPTNIGVGAAMRLQFGLDDPKASETRGASGVWKASATSGASEVASTSETSGARELQYDPEFDAFARRFHSEVFVGVDHPMIFIEKEYSMRRLSDGLPDTKSPTLQDSYYCAKGRGEIAHVMYPRHGGLDGRWSVDVIEHEGEFEGGIRMGRANDVLRMQGPNGKVFEFRKVSDEEARKIEDEVRFSRNVRAYAPEQLLRLTDGTELPAKTLTPMYPTY